MARKDSPSPQSLPEGEEVIVESRENCQRKLASQPWADHKSNLRLCRRYMTYFHDGIPPHDCTGRQLVLHRQPG
jgi:hypothetical protein